MHPFRSTLTRPSTRDARGAREQSHVVEQLRETLVEATPRLRGWLHLAIVPLTLVGGIVLVLLSPDAATRVGSAIFVSSALLLFGVSALYHCGTWSPRTRRMLRCLDHCNIFVLIAGSCTAFSLLLLDREDRTLMLTIVWASALLGVVTRVTWPDAPEWLSPPIYVACGWGALLFLPEFLDGAARLGGVGAVTLALLGAGGAIYTAGGVVYGLKRPDPWPRVFGFHEVFHALTVIGFVSHYTGIMLATGAAH